MDADPSMVDGENNDKRWERESNAREWPDRRLYSGWQTAHPPTGMQWHHQVWFGPIFVSIGGPDGEIAVSRGIPFV